MSEGESDDKSDEGSDGVRPSEPRLELVDEPSEEAEALLLQPSRASAAELEPTDDLAEDGGLEEEGDRRSLVTVLRPSLSGRPKRRHALVYVQRLSKVYPLPRGWWREPDLVQALDDVSFYIRHGETLGLVGESGSGKSTLGRCILRLTEPTVGRVVFDGQDVTAMSPAELRAARRRMQIVFQNPFTSLSPNMTVAEIVGEGPTIFSLDKTPAAREARVVAQLERVGLDAALAARYPHELSGGQRQRVAIARALAVEPDFLVLDEPTSALDLSVQAQILNLLQDLQEDLGLSLLFISHDLRVVQYVAHRIAVMYRGRLVELGPSDAVMKRRHHPYTRALLGAMSTTLDGGTRRLGLVETQEQRGPVPAKGCAYFPRCPSAEAGLCDKETPPLTEVVRGRHHRVACHHPNVEP